MENESEVFDITIIGGGPAGLFTAFYAGMRQTSVKVIESLPQLGGQLTALYPDKYIYDVAGFPKVKAQELINNLTDQMQQFKTAVCLNESVEDIVSMKNDVFALTTNKQTHYTKTIIITAGNGAFQPRKLNIKGADGYENSNLHYSVKNLDHFTDKKITVLGGGDSAVDWALMMEPIAKKVTLIHRRDKFRAHEHSIEKLQRSNVEILTSYVPTELVGDKKIEKLIVSKVKGEESRSIEVDEMLVNYGFISSLGHIKNWGLDISKNSIVVNSKMETNVDGIYAVGDICTYDGKVKLIATGFGEAPIAVSNAKVYINPDAKVQPLHSTTVMGNKEKSGSPV
ncbi:NAD(P)/FAD-dependent oxidoreductase [Alteribacillus bidgolensis]|uniref:Ferredoxin--NADP reductase n=1 Tax=Alteribacillus bidgolensis TaxID=930129 RepID=A0A1G8PLE1_9BACI|nr:NAD(P)/FAD-dependent oxidoreductase [Alteribacillus bidgolensis]SDI93277.1 thioredoxin reductase (NADPH) [Alteribacillus bidgolensis]